MSSLHSTNTHGNTTTGYNKDSTLNTTNSQYPKATTGAGDTYKTDDNIVKTGHYASGLENNNAPYNSGMTGTGYTGTGTGYTGTGTGHHVGTGTGALAGGAVGAAAGHPVAGAAVGAAAGHHNKHGTHGTHGLTHGTHHDMSGNLPAGSAVPVVGGQQNVITGVNNVPTAGPQYQNTLPNAANRDGLVVNDGLGGPLGGAVVLGGQCECLANGGSCSHGAGSCVCRGCTSKATTVNPGINVGVSTAQYTAPASTSGLGGGVGEHTGIAGLVHPNPNAPVAQQTTHTSTTTMHPATHTANTAMHTAGRNVDGDGRHTTHFGQGVTNTGTGTNTTNIHGTR